jgi:uncharacterized cofD-like protein
MAMVSEKIANIASGKFSIVYNLNMVKVCTIGGGSGMPTINQSLILAGIKDISSIVTTFDSGGDTGRMRTDERGRVLAFSDYWRALISLWSDGEQKEIWEEMLRYRDGRGRNFGNIFFQFMSEKTGNLSKVDRLFSHLTGAKLWGEVVPVSLSSAQLGFETRSGKRYIGEHNLDDLRMSRDTVKEIWLEPEVEANEEAVEVLKSAEVVIVCPGSMYGSVLINFLARGIPQAYRKSKARKILMTNIMSVANENDNFSQIDYVETFAKYLGVKAGEAFDLVLMADLDRLEKGMLNKVLECYRWENSQPIRRIENESIKCMSEDIAIVEEKNLRLRHGVEKLSYVWRQILQP